MIQPTKPIIKKLFSSYLSLKFLISLILGSVNSSKETHHAQQIFFQMKFFVELHHHSLRNTENII